VAAARHELKYFVWTTSGFFLALISGKQCRVTIGQL